MIFVIILLIVVALLGGLAIHPLFLLVLLLALLAYGYR